MGVRGPISERTDTVVRRNKPEVPVTKIPVIGPVEPPELALEELGLPFHPLVTDLYESIKDSAQSKYYEPSDWQMARITLNELNVHLWQTKKSAMYLTTINQMLTSLLLTEGDRRRVRMEVERNQTEGGDVIDVAEMFRQKLQQS